VTVVNPQTTAGSPTPAWFGMDIARSSGLYRLWGALHGDRPFGLLQREVDLSVKPITVGTFLTGREQVQNGRRRKRESNRHIRASPVTLAQATKRNFISLPLVQPFDVSQPGLIFAFAVGSAAKTTVWPSAKCIAFRRPKMLGAILGHSGSM